MNKVLCIGKYNKFGNFEKKQWSSFIEWSKRQCNILVIYSRMNYSTICYKFPKYCIINAIDKPDETLDIYAYKFNIISSTFWNYIKNYNYNIDIIDGISHMYFFHGDNFIGFLELVDYENYIVFEQFNDGYNNLLNDKQLIIENIQLCEEGRSDIDSIIQEYWEPFGI